MKEVLINEDYCFDEFTVKQSKQLFNITGDINVENKSINERIYTQWNKHENQYYPTGPTVKSIDCGIYSLCYNSNLGGWGLYKKTFVYDELYELPSKEMNSILKDFNVFWSSKDKYKKYSLIHKRGILLYGKPGCGKSAIVSLVSKRLINEMNGVIITINTDSNDDISGLAEIMPKIREIESDKPIVVMMEDIDAIASRSGVSALLNLLDGVNQLENIVYLATTNYPELLEDRIINRPSRFDRRYEIGLPSYDVRLEYIKKKVNDDNIDIKKWAKDTDELSIAHIKELILSVLVYDVEYDTALNNLKTMKNKTIVNEKRIGGFGKTQEYTHKESVISIC